MLNILKPSLLLIFIIALSIRFLYFPSNIYFGFDQARDAFTSLEIIKGDLKVIGPPTGVEGLYHGVFYYYLFSPIYFLSNGNPEAISAFLRIINALGIFLIFIAGSIIFNKKTGLIAALLYAISFEQSQYALFLNHPPLAVLTVLAFYLGLILMIYKKKWWGLPVSSLALGLSLQFEFVLIYLVPIYILLLIMFRKHLPKINIQQILISIFAFFLVTTTFIISFIKFHSFNFNLFFSLLPKTDTASSQISLSIFQNIYLILSRFINDNLFNFGQVFNPLILILFLLIGILLIKFKNLRSKIIFLLIWIFAGTLPYLSNKSLTPLYYYSVGASIGLLIMVGFMIEKVMSRFFILGILLLFIPIISNFNLIKTYNPQGSITTINVQSGMLLSDEKKVIDHIYQEAGNKSFAVNALTMPLSINTTWSYLFEWYGYNKYHYLPIWGGDLAKGFQGNLKVNNARSTLPETRFTIIEPSRGIRSILITKFLEEEGFFTTITKEKHFGQITVQVRKPII